MSSKAKIIILGELGKGAGGGGIPPSGFNYSITGVLGFWGFNQYIAIQKFANDLANSTFAQID